MEININNLNAKINADWSTVLNNIRGPGATEAMNSAGTVRGLTMTDGGAMTTNTIALKMPQIDAPVVADTGVMDALYDKLSMGESPFNFSNEQIADICQDIMTTMAACNAARPTSAHPHEPHSTDGTSGTNGTGGTEGTSGTNNTSGTTGTEGAANTSAMTSASSTVLFDIYALMALLLECGQKMRDASRDVRQAENQQVQKSIQNQADAQRSAAMTGLIASVAVCAIQVGMQAYNLSTQGKNFARQMDAQKASGVNEARANLKLAEMQAKPQDAAAAYEKASLATPEGVQKSVVASFNDSRVTKLAMTDESLNPQQQVANEPQPQPQQQVNEAQQPQPQQVANEQQPQQVANEQQPQQVANEQQPQQVANEQQPQPQQVANEQQPQPQQVANEQQPQQQVANEQQPQHQQVNDVQQQQQPQQQVNEAQQQQQPQQPQQVANEQQPQQEVVAQKEPTTLQEHIDAKKAELNNIKANGEGPDGTLTEGQQKQVTKLTTEIEAAERLKTMSPAERQTLYREQVKAELNDVRNDPNATSKELAYAEAYAANELAKVSTPQQVEADLKVAHENYNIASTMLQHDANHLKGVHMDTRSRAFGDMIMAIGQVGQGCVSSVTDMLRAEATEMGAEQQEAQEMLDQAKDLFTQCQSLIDSVIQLMQGVLQAEVQSMRDAIQA